MSASSGPTDSTLRLKTFGGALVEEPSGPIVGAITQRRRLAVLSIVAASGGGVSRDRLIGLLWPESDEDRARHALSQLLHGMRRELGADVIDGSSTALRLNANVLASDVQEFSDAIADGDLARAAELYRGPFLDGFYLNGCPDFERWVEERRAALAHQAEDAIETLAKRETDAGRATNWWRRLAALRPLDSRVALTLMQSAARRGDRAGALEYARTHTELLRAELGASPPAELIAFEKSLRDAPSAPAKRSPRLDASSSSAPAASESPFRPRWRWRSPAGGAALATIVILGIAIPVALRSGGSRVGAQPRWLLIADVQNSAGDPVFDRTVPVALAAAVGQSRRLRVVPPDRIARALVRMRRPGADSVLDEKLAREIAERDDIPIVAVPSISRADNAYELSTKFVDATTGGVLGFASERAKSRADVLDALDRLGRRMRRELGESRWAVSTRTVPLPRVTTTSLDALKKFADAERAFREGKVTESGNLWTQAVSLDSTFALAHANLGMLAARNNTPTLADSHYTLAIRHLNGLPEREQVFIRSSAKRARGDFAGSVELLEAYLAQTPADIGALRAVGYDFMRLRKSNEAVATLMQVLAVDSLDDETWINVASAQKQLGHFPEALRAYGRAFALTPTLILANDNLNLEYATAFVLAGQRDSAKAVIALLAASPDPMRRARALRSSAYLSSFNGHYGDAARDLSRAIVLNRATPLGVTSELRNRLLLATALDELGRSRDAARELDSAFVLVMRIDAEATLLYWVGKALARSGDISRSTRLLDVLEKKARPGSPTDRAALEALRGEVLVARGKGADAMTRFDAAWQADSNANVLESFAFGAASSGDLERAAALYERMTRGTVFGTEGQHYWRLAPYWLARVHERANKLQPGRAAYERFVSSWPDRNADLRSLADARERLARRRGG